MKLQDSNLHAFYNTAYSWLLLHGLTLVISIIVLLIGLRVIKFIGTRLRGRMSKRKVHSSLQPFFLSLTLTALYIFLIIGVAAINDINVTAFSAVLGGFSVAVGLALSGTFQNFAGGVLILLLKPFELDDNIIAQGQDGIVVSIQIFYTVLRTPDNKTIIIPNGKLFNEVIVNVTREGKRRLDFEVKLGYSIDVDQVKQIMTTAIASVPNVLTDLAIRVGIIAFEVDCIRFTVNVWVSPADFLNVKIALQEKIIKDLKAAGVKLLGT
ncbi:mechanosensitive ion channel domain-containing protein [Mucilaginibacter sp.]|uniref:mechanosensitive ion channel family protein n=1 Tax=Mucilaginibacter sp. TaxID=1882438 RepID=UPI0026342D54|nr:mechanosensitive ion channel domain-containing protein [Mucilaginibacter sp.]MDB4925720.1 Small conductance mechanosensitive channel [Mucilaginibacter sp.]